MCDNKNSRLSRCLLLLLMATFFGRSDPVLAQLSICDSLSVEQQKVKQKFFAVLHPYDACDETFERCLAKKPPAPIVLRLAAEVCRHIQTGRSQKQVEHLLARRANSVFPMGKPVSFDLDDSTLAGLPKAPVRVVIYACARCPFCKAFVPNLQREVAQGSLVGKVQLRFRPFPLRNHPGSTEGGLAMLSAAQHGRFWPFVIKMYDQFDAFDSKVFGAWASEVGMKRATFEKTMAASETRQALVVAKKEGIRNKVDATPTLFIDGHRYVYELRLDVVMDVLLEVYERKKSTPNQP